MQQESALKRHIHGRFHDVICIHKRCIAVSRHLVNSTFIQWVDVVDLFFWDHVYLAKLGAWLFIWRGLAFYGFMFWFAIIEAQVVIHAMFPYCESKATSFLEFALALGGINFHIWRFFRGNFSDLSIQITTWALRSFGEVTRSSIKAPVLIEISGFVYKCC
jgi:hypothetical protein